MGIKAKADKIAGYVRDYGISYAAKKVYYRYKIKYRLGKKYFPFEISQEQREKEQKWKPAKQIKISILVPLYNTPEKFLREMIESVQNQTYGDFELCLADASDNNGKNIEKIVSEYTSDDNRIKYIKLKENRGISINTNEAARIATGNFIGLMDHDDILHPSALYHVATAADGGAEFIYTDELSFDGRTDRVQSINLKPDFTWETFRYNNFICHFTAFKKELFEKTGGYRSEFDGGQDYDLFLRILEMTNKVQHIQQVLYYWRIHSASSSSGVAAKPYIVEAGKKALEEHMLRSNIKADVKASKKHGPFYHIDYELPDVNNILLCRENGENSIVKLTETECIIQGKEADEIPDYVVFARENYKLCSGDDAEFEWLKHLIKSLQSNENMVAGAMTIDEKKHITHGGYAFESDYAKMPVKLYDRIPVAEPGYMNILEFSHSVSLLSGAVLVVKYDLYLEYCKKLAMDVDWFTDRTWFEICLFAKKRSGNCVITPYVRFIQCQNADKVGNSITADDWQEILCKYGVDEGLADENFNRWMSVFGKYYGLI